MTDCLKLISIKTKTKQTINNKKKQQKKQTKTKKNTPKGFERQADIDKIINQIKRKYLTKLQLPCSLRDKQAAYLNSPHFRYNYLSIGMNKLPNTTRSARKLENDLRNTVNMIYGGLLYRYIQGSTGDSEPVLCVPVFKIDIFLELFYSSILGGHMGMSKCVLTLQHKFYCPNLAYHARMYIISCHVCQTFKEP